MMNFCIFIFVLLFYYMDSVNLLTFFLLIQKLFIFTFFSCYSFETKISYFFTHLENKIYIFFHSFLF